MLRAILVIIAVLIIAYLLGILRLVHLHLGGAIHLGHISLTTVLLIVVLVVLLALALRR